MRWGRVENWNGWHVFFYRATASTSIVSACRAAINTWKWSHKSCKCHLFSHSRLLVPANNYHSNDVIKLGKIYFSKISIRENPHNKALHYLLNLPSSCPRYWSCWHMQVLIGSTFIHINNHILELHETNTQVSNYLKLDLCHLLLDSLGNPVMAFPRSSLPSHCWGSRTKTQRFKNLIP